MVLIADTVRSLVISMGLVERPALPLYIEF